MLLKVKDSHLRVYAEKDGEKVLAGQGIYELGELAKLGRKAEQKLAKLEELSTITDDEEIRKLQDFVRMKSEAEELILKFNSEYMMINALRADLPPKVKADKKNIQKPFSKLEFDEFIGLVDEVQNHEHFKEYCGKDPANDEGECRFNYPLDENPKAKVIYEDVVTKKGNKYTKILLEQKRDFHSRNTNYHNVF